MKLKQRICNLWQSTLLGVGRCGFTLVELSISLVIIGLVLGGILFGRDLLKSAEIRKGIGSLEKVATAVNTFKLKYNCIPGDCTNTTSLFSNTFVFNGNGNGRIDQWANESRAALESLLDANLITRSMMGNNSLFVGLVYLTGYNDSYSYLYYADLYSVDNDGTWTYGDPSILPNATKIGITVTWANFIGGSVNHPALSPSDAFRIDQKLDDGLPQTGKFFGHGTTGLCTTGNAYQNSDVIGCRTVYYLPGN